MVQLDNIYNSGEAVKVGEKKYTNTKSGLNISVPALWGFSLESIYRNRNGVCHPTKPAMKSDQIKSILLSE